MSWIVYTSLLHADTSPLSLAEEHRGTEAELAASGIPHTILRNGWYVENHTASIPGALAGGAFLGAAGDGRISAAPRADYAAAAVAVLSGEGHVGKTYELAADEAFTLADLAAEISRQAGRGDPLPRPLGGRLCRGAGRLRPPRGRRPRQCRLRRRRRPRRALRRRPPALAADRPSDDPARGLRRGGDRRGEDGRPDQLVR